MVLSIQRCTYWSCKGFNSPLHVVFWWKNYEADEIAQTESYDEESLHMRQLLKTKLVDMDLICRALNCLKAAEVDTLGDLVSFNKMT
jgi:DNA-directed RNA polymerase alpha subunit